MSFLGYPREDGSVGVRNKILVLALSDCCEPLARMIANKSDIVVPITQHHGCIDDPIVVNTLIGVCLNPNIASVMILVMGCEGLNCNKVFEEVSASGKRVEILSVQQEGGTKPFLERANKIIREMERSASQIKRRKFSIDHLVVGVKCGGSDSTNGIASNPSVGKFSDCLIDHKGSVIFGEPIEALGAEEVLAVRALNEGVADKIRRVVKKEFLRSNVGSTDFQVMCDGNFEGGLSTIEEKALGSVLKSGSRTIVDVLEVNEDSVDRVPKGGGCYFQDGTHLEPMAMTLMAAAGAQLIVYVSGRGGTLGHAISPMINVNANPQTCEFMTEDIDVRADGIIRGVDTLQGVGKIIFDYSLEVASGKITKSEGFGYENFSVFTRDPRIEKLIEI